MIAYIIAAVCIGGIGFLLGWLWAKKKHSADTLVSIQVIANLKATIAIYKITIEEQKSYMSNKITDLKIENARIKEENNKK